VGTVQEVDAADQTVLLRLPLEAPIERAAKIEAGLGGQLRYGELWFPVEALDTTKAEAEAASQLTAEPEPEPEPEPLGVAAAEVLLSEEEALALVSAGTVSQRGSTGGWAGEVADESRGLRRTADSQSR
jgi:hypothetical protein